MGGCGLPTRCCASDPSHLVVTANERAMKDVSKNLRPAAAATNAPSLPASSPPELSSILTGVPTRAERDRPRQRTCEIRPIHRTSTKPVLRRLEARKTRIMRKLIVSIHSTANNIVTGSPSGDETDFMQWAQPGMTILWTTSWFLWTASTPSWSGETRTKTW